MTEPSDHEPAPQMTVEPTSWGQLLPKVLLATFVGAVAAVLAVAGFTALTWPASGVNEIALVSLLAAMIVFPMAFVLAAPLYGLFRAAGRENPIAIVLGAVGVALLYPSFLVFDKGLHAFTLWTLGAGLLGGVGGGWTFCLVMGIGRPDGSAGTQQPVRD